MIESSNRQRNGSVESSDYDSSSEDEVDHDDKQLEVVNPLSENTIAKEETQQVRRYKIVVFTVLTISAIIFAVFVNLFIRNNEQGDFENAFREGAAKVFKAIGSSIERTLIPLDVLSVIMVSHAKAFNATWPFVTLPDYALQMSKILPQTDGIVIQSIHLVEPEERTHWEWYTSQNNHWVNESIAFQDN